MPISGSYYFAFSVIRSIDSNIELGIAPISYNQQNNGLQCNQQMFISYNCYNGRIKDNKHNQFQNFTCWRHGGEKVQISAPFQMRVAIDVKTNFIDWYV